jgi:hypothetical protein
MVEIGIVEEAFSSLQCTMHTRSHSFGMNEIEMSANTRTFLTTGSTHGLLLSSLYAPTPRLIFCGNVSSLYAAVSLKML